MPTTDVPVTIVVTPRERFAQARKSLASIIAHTQIPYRLVFVAGGARDDENAAFAALCERHGFAFISRPHFLPPNVARNLGLALVDTPYAVFIDNDVVVEPGWLEALVACAQDTQADLVSPVVMVHTDFGDEFHSFGGTLKLESAGPQTRIAERHHRQPSASAGHRPKSDYAEFHCVLVRRAVLDLFGPFDERILNAAEHIDLALQMCIAGRRGVSEPRSVVTYYPTGYTVGDFANYDQRWDTGWYGQTMSHLAKKWNLEPHSSFFADYESSLHALRERCLLPQAWARDPRAQRRVDPAEVPQSIVALLERMPAAGYDTQAIVKVRDAYLVASELFANAFRASGRHFLSHTIGVGGILSLFGANASVIAAGILHAAYQNGAFPKTVPEDKGAMRRWLRRRTGASIENLVYVYSTLNLEEATGFVSGDIDAMPIPLANALMIRAADGIENRVMGDHRYFESAAWLRDSNALAGEWAPIFSAVAGRLNCSGLADALALAIEDAVPSFEPSHLRPARPLNYAIDTGSHAIVSLPARYLGALGGHEAFQTLPRATLVNRLDVDLGHVAALNDGAVTRVAGGVKVAAGGEPWSYCAAVDLSKLTLQGPGLVEVSASAVSGEIGFFLLENGTTTVKIGQEASVSAETGPLTVQFPVEELGEIGHLVFRRWPDTQPQSAIIVSSIAVHTP